MDNKEKGAIAAVGALALGGLAYYLTPRAT